MKARLFQFATSPFCAKVRKILDYKGLEYELVEVDYLERKELLAASGQIMVPALTLEGGETIVVSERIAMRLEELHSEPTLFPPGARGLHTALARYIESAVEDAIFRIAVIDEVEHFRRQGADREAMWRLIRDRRYGDRFVDRMRDQLEANWAAATAVLVPFEEQLAAGVGAFLTGRIGYADFALYGQLHLLALTGELKIPAAMPHLRAYYARMDRITASLDAAL
ncbi:MAG TPA: glutathione S-transferase family protein [Candidatus Binataceae bacterium]|nr:glutathione S-transferase family protein [Candidatus Binataceae bacterium]